MSVFGRLRRIRQFAVLVLVFAPMIGMATQMGTSLPSSAAPSLAPGNLLVATSVFQNDPNIVAGIHAAAAGLQRRREAPTRARRR